jgi:hypothetical protein
MRLTTRAWVVLGGIAALAAMTVFAPTVVVVVAWVIAALGLAGAGLGSSPAVQLRGQINRIDPDASPPSGEVKRR